MKKSSNIFPNAFTKISQRSSHDPRRAKASKARLTDAIAPLFSERQMFERLEDRTMLSAAGALDATFNPLGTPPGVVTTNISPSGNDEGTALAVQSTDHKIVVVGNSTSNGTIELARYNTDGSLDSGFGGGTVTTSVPSGFIQANAVAIDGSGNIFVAGTTLNAGNFDIAVAKYSSTGALVTGFGTNGVASVDFNHKADAGFAVAVDATGVIVAGYGTISGSSNREELAVTRLNASTGALDTSFNSSGTKPGTILTPVGSTGNDQANSIVIQTVGSNTYYIVAGDATNTNGSTDFALARYTSSGTLDTSFGASGTVQTDLSGGGDDIATSLGVSEPSGTLFAGGVAAGDFALADYSAAGVMQAHVVSAIGSGFSQANGLAIQYNGKVVLSGYTTNGSGSRVVELARYNNNNNTSLTADPAFGTGGFVSTPYPSSGPTVDAQANGVAIDSGKIIIAGTASTGSDPSNPEVFTVARYQLNNAPTLASTTAALDTINEDDTTSAGTLVSALVSRLAGADVDGDAVGLAITGFTGAANGTWQYNTGSTWTAIPAVTANAALLLSPTDLVRFVPNLNFNTGFNYNIQANNPQPTLSVVAWDQTAGSDGGFGNTAPSPDNQLAAFSTTPAATLSLTINAVNDAPTASVSAPSQTVLISADSTIYGISVADVDANDASPTGGILTLTLTVGAGTLTLSTSVNGGVTSATGNGSGTVTASGTLAQLNATLDADGGLVYDSPATTGLQTLGISINDNGNTGIGGPLTGTNSIALNVSNDEAQVWVSHNWTITNDVGAPGLSQGDTVQEGAGPAHTYGVDAFSTIQAGVNGVSSGGIVSVYPGTYAENVNINQSVDLEGAEVGQDPVARSNGFIGGKANPTLESIITAPIVAPNAASNDLLHVDASNVTINGFVIDGNNAAIADQSGATLINGVDTDSRRAIETENSTGSLVSAGNAVVEYNVIQNFAQRGVELANPTDTSPATSGDVVTQNDISNFGTTGILMAFNAYGSVTNNTIVASTGANAGIMVQDYTTNTPSPSSLDVSSNKVTVGQDDFGGIWVNLFHPTAATSLTINSNIVNAASGVTGSDGITFGIYLTSIDSAGPSVGLTGNQVGATGGQFAAGIAIWNLPTSSPVSVSGGSVGNSVVGIDLDNVDPNFGGGGNTTVSVSSVAISGGTTGIRVGAVPSTVPGAPLDDEGETNIVAGNVLLNLSGGSITGAATGIEVQAASTGSFTASLNLEGGTSITGGTTGLQIDGANASVTGNTLANTIFTGQSGNYLTLSNGAEFGKVIDGTSASFDGTVGSSADDAQGWAIDDKITDALDDGTLGYVRIHSGFVFVTSASGTGAIARGVAAAVTNDHIEIENGTYFEANIDINKSVTIEGQSQTGVVVGPSIADGHIDSSFAGPVDNGFVIQQSGVTIQDLTVDGNANAALNTSSGQTQNFRAGVIVDYTAGEFDNSTVTDATFTNLYRRGVQIYDYNGSRVTTGNSVSDSNFSAIGTNPAVAVDAYDIIFVQSSGSITNNIITDSANGIATNFSTQYPTYAPTVVITGNQMSAFVATGVTDIGVYGSGLALDSQINNNIINMTGDGQADDGIILTYLSDVRGTQLQVEGNTVTTDGNDIGLSISHRSFGVTSTFTPVLASGNHFTQIGGAGTGQDIAIQVSDTDNQGDGNDNTSGIISGNTITGYDTGIQVLDVDGYQVIATIGGASASDSNTINGVAGSTGILVTGAGASATISNNSTTIENNAIGIDIEGGGTASISNNTFSGNGLDLKVGTGSTVSALTNNAFTGTQYIDNEGSGNIDASTDTFNVGAGSAQIAGSALNLAQAFSVEDRITDYLDKPGSGYVELNATNVYVSQLSDTTTNGAIQRGVNVAPTDGTVNVQAGTYIGANTVDNTDGYVAAVGINKAITLLGPNAAFDPNSDSTPANAQAILLPGSSDPTLDATESVGIDVTSSNVTIEGLTIDGSNPGLVHSGGVSFRSVPLDEAEGIVSNRGEGNIKVQGNLIENLNYTGVDFYNYDNSGGVTTDNVISNNLIQHISDNIDGIGVLIYNNFYAQITNNLISDTYVGVQTGNFSAANTDSNFAPEISNNTIATRHDGVFYNLHYSGASAFTIAGNTITAIAQPAGDLVSPTNWTGIAITSQQSTVSVSLSNNSINGTGATFSNVASGYVLWDDPTSGSISISGGSVSGVNYGVWANSYEGYASNGDAVSASVSGVTINASQVGVYVEDSPQNTEAVHPNISLSIIGGSITAASGGVGILVSGAKASATISGVTIDDPTYGIEITGGTASISNNIIENNDVGIFATAGGSISALTGNTFTTNGIDLEIDSSAGPVSIGDGNSFSGTTDYIENVSSQNFDLSGDATNTFGGVNAATLAVNPTNLPSFYAIEDKIVDAIDQAGLGLVRIHSSNLFVTPNSFIAPATDDTGAIQRAINAATVGDNIQVEAGTFLGAVNVNKTVNILGAGSTGSGSIISGGAASSAVTLAASGASALAPLTLSGLLIEGGTRAGIDLNSTLSHILLSNLAVSTVASYALEVDNSAVLSDLNLSTVSLSTSGGVGFNVSTTGSVNGLTITGSHFDNNAYGLETQNVSNSTGNQSRFTNISISSSTFSNDTVKGIYVETLDHATLNGITVNNSGTVNSSPNGVNLNLKGGTYSGDVIENSSFDSDATANPSSAALAIDIRNDAPSYNTHPASITGITLTDLTFTGSSPIELSIGDNATGVTMSGMQFNGTGLGVLDFDTASGFSLADSSFASSLAGYVVNSSPFTVDGTGATFGSVTPTDNTVSDLYGVEDKIGDAIDVGTWGLVRLRTGNVYTTPSSFYAPYTTTANIQNAVNAASNGDTVHIEGGSYTGSVDTGVKGLTIDPGASPAQASPAQVTINGNLTLHSGDTLDMEINGLTAGTQYDQLVVTGDVNLGGATLDTSASTIAGTVNGNSVEIVDNQSADPISGTFLGLANGTTLTINGQLFEIFYGGGTGNDVVLTRVAATPPPSVVYVNASWSNLSDGTDADGPTGGALGNGSAIGYDEFGDIQSAVNAVAANGTVYVYAGTYAQDITINKSLSLLSGETGQSATTRTSSYNPAIEAIITSPDTDSGLATSDLINITASNVTINGFVLDGTAGGFGAHNAIATVNSGNVGQAINDLNVQDNIVQNVDHDGIAVLGAGGSTVTSGDVVSGNVIRGFTDYGVILAYNAYGSVTSNTITMPDDAEAGVWIYDFTANGATTPTQTVDVTSNNITAAQNAFGGIWVNLVYPASAILNITGNTVNAAADTASGQFPVSGIYLTTLQNGVVATLTNNIIGSSGGQFAAGIGVWNAPVTTPVSVTGGTISRSDVGIDLDNVDANFGGGDDTTLNVSNVTITGATTGIRVGAIPSTLAGAPFDNEGETNVVAGNVVLNLSGGSITGATTGVDVEALSTGSFTAHAQISGSATISASAVGIQIQGSNASAAVTGDTITSGAQGIDLESGATAIINGNNIIDAQLIGISVQSGSDATITANQLLNDLTPGGGVGIQLNGGSATITSNQFASGANAFSTDLVILSGSSIDGGVLNGNQFNASDTYIDNESTSNVDASNNQFAGFTPGTSVLPADLASDYAVEDKITDYLDNPLLGYVKLNANNVFVSQLSDQTTNDAIQRGVNVASPGNTVNIQAGTFIGQVSISKDLTLTGASQAGTIIQAPASLPLFFHTSADNHPVVLVQNAQVTIQQLTVDANGQGNGNYRIDGIAFEDAGGTIDHVTVEHVRETPLNGDQQGVAIFANVDNATPRSVTITNNTIFDYQKNGMVLSGAGLTVDVEHNSVTGAGPTALIAQNGIELGYGAGGTINDNTISGNSYTVASTDSTGILVFQSASGTSITNNTISGSDIGIFAQQTAGTVPITGNTVTGSPGAGIVADQGTFTIASNTLSGGVGDGGTANNTGDGIDLYDSQTGTTVQNNLIQSNTGTGVYIDSSVTGLGAISNNSISGNATAGLDNETSGTVNAINNWWGSANGPTASGNTFNVGSQGDKIIGPGTTTYAPWLNSGHNNATGPGFVPDAGSSFAPVTDITSGGQFSSIQAAVNAANPNDVIVAAAGTFSELVTVDKTLTVEGAQAGVDARTRSGPETIVSNAQGDFQIEADKVTIDGFTLEGVTETGQAADLGSAIWTNPSFSGTHGGTQILNNIIQGNIAGIELDNDGTFQTVVQHNLIQNNNAAGPGSGSAIETSFGLSNALIDSNTFTNNSNASIVVEAPSDSIVISNNHADSGIALFDTTNSQLTGNTITNAASDAIFLGGGDSGISVTGNIVTSVLSGNAALEIANPYGVAINSDITISGNTFDVHGGGGSAIKVSDGGTNGSAYTGTLTLSGDTITTSGTDLSILNESTTPIDATAEKFNTILASSATLAQQFVIVDTIVDGVDVSGFGLVRTKAGSVYVTPNSFFVADGTTAPSIQRGADAASSGDIVNVEAGTYTSGVTVNKQLTFRGAGAGVDARTRSASETIINSSGGAFGIHANGVVIDGFTLEGQSADNSGPGFGYAIWMAPGVDGTQVLNNIITGNDAGIALSNAGSTQAQIEQNLFKDNTSGLATDIYADQYTSGSGGVQDVLISDNSFTNTAFVENAWAVGISNTGTTAFNNIQFLNNSVSNSGRGVYFYGSSNVTISDSTITGATHYAIGLFGGDYEPGEANNSSVTITGNALNGNGTGVLIEDGGTAAAPAFVSGTLDIANNYLDNNTIGVDITQFALSGGTVSINNNSFVGNSTAGLENDSSTTVDATSNWWGDADGPDTALNTFHPNNPAGDRVIGSHVTIAPWLISGAHTAQTPGFYPTTTATSTPPVAPHDLVLVDDTGLSSSDDVTDDNTPHISGSSSALEVGFTVTLFDTDGVTVLGTGIVQGDGSWIVQSSALTDGSHSLTAKITDGMGNQSAASNPLTIMVDTIAPIVSTPVLAAASDSGFSHSDDITNVNTPTFTGTVTVENGSIAPTVAIYDHGGTLLGSATITPGSDSLHWNYSFTVSSPLMDGSHSITAKAEDVAGNTTTSSALSITVDTQNPVVGTPVLTTASDSGFSNSDDITNVNTPTFTGTFTVEDGTDAPTVNIYDGNTLLGAATVNGSSTSWSWSFTVGTALADGIHSITAKATDLVGDIGTSPALSVTIDTQNPAPTVDGSNANTESGFEGTLVSLSGLDHDPAPSSGIETYLWHVVASNGQTIADGSSQNFSFTPVDNGTYNVTYTVTDKAGNVGTATDVITVANVAPSGLSLLATPGTINEGGSTVLSGSFTDPGVLDTHTVVISWGDGSPNTTLPLLGAGVLTFTAPAHTYNNNIASNTIYTINVTVTDKDGGTTSANTSVTVDYVSPTVTLTGSQTDPTNPVANDAEGSIFTLTIGPVVDPGVGETVEQYVINWGDSTQTINASDLPANGQINHEYLDGHVPQGTTTPSYIIAVDIIDTNGYHANAGTLPVVVYNIPPIASFSGSSQVNEGSTGSVSFFSQTDPSPVDVSAGFHYAYDFTYNPNQPSVKTFTVGGVAGVASYDSGVTSSSATVPADTLLVPGIHTILGRIIDKDGGFTDYTYQIDVVNVQPVVTIPPTSPVGAGGVYTNSGSFVDPGNDGPWTATVDYGDGSGPQPLTVDSFDQSFSLNHTYTSTGNFTITVNVTDHPISYQGQAPAASLTGTGYGSVNVSSTTLQVVNFTPNASGFDVTFNRAINLNVLNLYGTTLSPTPGLGAIPDLVLFDDTTNAAVNGSLIWDPTTDTAHFVKTGSPLPQHTYTLTLTSGTNSFEDTFGSILDGDSNGVPGGNYVTNFSISYPGAAPRVLSLPDFARGPGQAVNIPATSTGLPISLNDATNVTAVDFNLVYNPTLLNITGASLGSRFVSAGWSLTFNFLNPTTVRFTASGPALSGSLSNLTLINLTAAVPASPTAYFSGADLQLQSVLINEGAISSIGDSAVQKVAFLGDASGNGSYSAADSADISRVVTNLDTGFNAYPLTDPVIVGDATGDGTLSGQDAADVGQKALPGNTITDIPNIPAGFFFVPGGIDPAYSAPTDVLAVRGGQVVLSLDLSDLTGINGFTLLGSYDPTVLSLTASELTVGNAIPGWSIQTSVDPATHMFGVSIYNTVPTATGFGEVAEANFSVLAHANPGVTSVPLSGPSSDGSISYTYGTGSIDIPASFAGTASADQYTVRLDSGGTNVQVWEDVPETSAPTYTFPTSLFSNPNFDVLAFSTLAGSDSVTVDYSNGDPVPSGGITFDGGSGVDTLYIDASTSASDQFNVSAAGVSYLGSLFSLTNDEQIVINGGASNDTVTQTATSPVPYTFNGGSGADVMNIEGGSYTFTSDASLGTQNLTVEVSGSGSSVTFDGTQHLAGLNIGAGALAQVAKATPNSAHGVLVTSALTISGSGVLDLTNNDMLVKNGVLGTLSTPGTIANWLKTGFNAGAGYWNGTGGIISSAAASDSTYLTTLGYRYGNGTAFDGQSATASDLEIKYTYYGDADLNGVVNGADYQQVDLGFGTHATGWSDGDFNYDGVVDGSDYSLIDNAYNQIVATGASPLALITGAPVMSSAQLVSKSTAAVSTGNNAATYAVFNDGDSIKHRKAKSAAQELFDDEQDIV